MRISEETLTARLEGEPPDAYNAFLDYLMQPANDRSVRRLVDQYIRKKADGASVPSVRPATIFGWSSKFTWQERIDAYDDNERRKRLAEAQKEIDTMHRRHIQIAQAMQGKVLLWLKEAENTLDKPADLVGFLKVATELERKARGMPNEIIELSGMSTDELVRKYRNLLLMLGREEVEAPEEEETA